MITLQTERLILRNYTPDDVPAVHEYFSDERVTQYEDFWPMSLEDVEKMISRWKDMDNRLLAVLKETGEVVGSVGYWVDDEGDEPEYSLDYDFNPKFWHKGYATEAAREVLRHLTEDLLVSEVWGDCDKRNTASARVFERLGFEFVEEDEDELKEDAEGNPMVVTFKVYRLKAKKDMDMKFKIEPMTDEEAEFVEERINEYADSMAPAEPHTEEEQLVYKIADEEGNVIGGCIVNVHAWGRAVLAKLWVDERYRRHGLGSVLIRAAENAAREKNCYYLCLGTADYMARPLYEKHGFRVFTVNRDIPMGHISWSLCKRLDRDIPDYVPTDNTAAERYKAEPGTEEDAEIIDRGLDEFCVDVVPDKHEHVTLNRKLTDADGNMIAAVIAEVDEDDTAFIEGVWVDERYRRQGLGTYIMAETEREAKEIGTYVVLSYCCDWVSGFFFKNGYTARGELDDYPKDHIAYELEKRIRTKNTKEI